MVLGINRRPYNEEKALFHLIEHRGFAANCGAVALVFSAFLTAPTPSYAHSAPFVSLSSAVHPSNANFLREIVSNDARQVANWVVASNDNAGLPFIIVDKVQAKVFVFDSAGLLRGASSALLGMARGDDTVSDIGSRALSAIRPEERTTAAGRFVATLGRDLHQDTLWIDYGSSLALHRVAIGRPEDHRLQRLATPSPGDKRVSYGCVNVPVKFYEDVVVGAFTGTSGIVYILPEIKTIEEVFPNFKIAQGDINEIGVRVKLGRVSG
jgi:hypothetical protein